MITVYIWSFRGKTEAWGHASMLVDKTYMSWWPEHPGQITSRIHRNIYSSGPFRDRKFEDDVSAERQSPDHEIELLGLDEDAVKDWWQSFGLARDGVLYQGPLLPWETLTMNCSTVVAHGLTLAGGKKHATLASWNVVWTPKNVLRYATAIREGLARAGK